MARIRLWTRALVTGASSGIGEAFARELAPRGTALVLVARSGDRLHALAEELRDSHAASVEVLPADLTDAEDLARVEARIRDDDEIVDLLINNAGSGSVGRFVKLDLEREEAQIRLNVVAVMRLTHAALPGMRQRQHGGILNVSSMAGFQPTPTMATYGATKTFVTSFTEAVHEELRGSGVHATVLCPGFTRTRFQAAAGVEEEASAIPDPLWDDATSVARLGLTAVSANRAVAVPGIANRATSAASRVLPTALTRKVVALGSRLGR